MCRWVDSNSWRPYERVMSTMSSTAPLSFCRLVLMASFTALNPSHLLYSNFPGAFYFPQHYCLTVTQMWQKGTMTSGCHNLNAKSHKTFEAGLVWRNETNICNHGKNKSGTETTGRNWIKECTRKIHQEHLERKRN